MSLFFEFVQFEFTHSVGPPAGRYVVAHDGVATEEPEDGRTPVTGVRRAVASADVLVVTVVGAPAARPRLRRRAREVHEESPAEVPLLLATFVKGTAPLEDAREAQRALDAVRGSEDEQQRFVYEGLEVLNRAVRAYRAGAHDPYAIEVTPRDARRIRIGFGTTEEVGEGRWQEAIELPPPLRARVKRTERLRPSEAVAAVLSGRGHVLEGEDVILRALVDLDHGRTRAAALQVRAAMTLLAPELEDIDAHVEKAAELAAVASDRALDAAQIAELETVIEKLDGLVDAWRYEASAAPSPP